jgi:hypothetical protein
MRLSWVGDNLVNEKSVPDTTRACMPSFSHSGLLPAYLAGTRAARSSSALKPAPCFSWWKRPTNYRSAPGSFSVVGLGPLGDRLTRLLPTSRWAIFSSNHRNYGPEFELPTRLALGIVAGTSFNLCVPHISLPPEVCVLVHSTTSNERVRCRPLHYGS